MEPSCLTTDRRELRPAAVTQVDSPTEPRPASQAASHVSWLGQGRKRRAIIWGITSTVLSAIGLIGLALFEQYNGMLGELRSDLRHFNETSGEYVKKDKLQKCWDTMKECSREMNALSASKEQLERELTASLRAREEMSREMQRMRERLAYLEGLKMAKPHFDSPSSELEPDR
jgi:septal ring factor EnvC (AmiA/AmiB activator)